MANISSLISLDAMVRRLLGKEGKDNEDYLRYMQIACDGLREFHIHDFNIEVTAVVDVNTTNNTFSYPLDFVRYTQIATPIDGRWWVYTKDDTMAPLLDDAGETVLDAGLINVAEYEHPSSYSTGGGTNRYYFRQDDANRRFQVGGFTPDIVVLKYVSNGINSAGTINIPDYAKPALESYVRWQIAEYDNPALSRIDWLKRRYDEDRRKLRMAQRPNLQDLIDTINSTSAQGPTRG